MIDINPDRLRRKWFNCYMPYDPQGDMLASLDDLFPNGIEVYQSLAQSGWFDRARIPRRAIMRNTGGPYVAQGRPIPVDAATGRVLDSDQQTFRIPGAVRSRSG